MDGILEGAVPPKSCTSVTVTIDKIVLVLGEGCMVGTVTGLTMTTTSKSGNTATTTRMTVTINDVMPQEIETTGETEAGNNIGNKEDVGIETNKVAGEAGQMAVQLSDRRRREKEKKKKYCSGKKERDMAVDIVMCSNCIHPATKHAKNNCTYREKEKKRKYSVRKKERDMSVDSAMCSNWH